MMLKRRARWIAMVFIAVLVFALVGVGSMGRYAMHHGQRFVQESMAAVAMLRSLESTSNFATTETGLMTAQGHWSAAKTELAALRPLIAPLAAHGSTLRDLPGVGVPLGESLSLWEFTEAVSDMGDALLTVAIRGSRAMDTSHSPAVLLADITHIHTDLSQAMDAYERARVARAQIGTLAWLPPNYTATIQAELERWDEIAPILSYWLPVARDMAHVLPALTGMDHPATYLVLLQTSDELRATGGFITGVGTVRVTGGVITEVELQKVTSAEPERPWQQGVAVSGAWVQPPLPLSRYMGLGNWVLRDANWSADFPTSARHAARFWQQQQGESVTGVIAINEQGLTQLLTLVGGVTLADGSVVTAETLKPLTLAYIYHGDSSLWADRQGDFSNALATALLTELEHQWQSRWLTWIEQVSAERGKHNILFTVFDPTGAALLRQWRVDGALPSVTTTSDFLYVVEQNVSYNKLSPFIQQNIEYHVVLDTNAQPITSTLTITSANHYRAGQGWADYPATYYTGGRWNTKTRHLESWPGYYGGFTTLYTSGKSRMAAVTGFDDNPLTDLEPGYSAVGGYVGLYPGESQQLQWQWHSVGEGSGSGDYQLQIRYQPGAPPSTVQIHVDLPQGYRATALYPPPTTVSRTRVTWELVLQQDEVVQLRLSPEGIGTLSQATATATAPANVTPDATLSPLATPVGTSVPVRLEIPTLNVDAPIVPVGLEPSGIMASPATAQEVGWYLWGARPGDGSNAVLAGHVDWKGEIGVFQNLDELSPGDVIVVTNDTQIRYRYIVQEQRVYDVNTAPLVDIFGATPQDTLTLITCTGRYDEAQARYEQRLIVRAIRVE
jgi:LPXTG-site transpeptidase (sortase) family protein